MAAAFFSDCRPTFYILDPHSFRQNGPTLWTDDCIAKDIWWPSWIFEKMANKCLFQLLLSIQTSIQKVRKWLWQSYNLSMIYLQPWDISDHVLHKMWVKFYKWSRYELRFVLIIRLIWWQSHNLQAISAIMRHFRPCITSNWGRILQAIQIWGFHLSQSWHHATEPNLTKPNQTQPNTTKSNQTRSKIGHPMGGWAQQSWSWFH